MMNLQEENKNRIKQFYNKTIEKHYHSNPTNIQYQFPRRSSVTSSKTSIFSMPSETSHTYDLFSQNKFHHKINFSINMTQPIDTIIHRKIKGAQKDQKPTQRLKLVSTTTKQTQRDKQQPIKEDNCCCFRFFMDSKVREDREKNSKRVSDREYGVEVGKRVIKKVVSCEGKKKISSTKNPSSFSKYSQKERYSPLTYHRS